ncbi:MAG: 4-(cytidine 5'-diphospho)-2-C-methyl-D-erythritol kinase [Ruminococcaceae bacterium]|nr:4-(cytidine 5'-diphospho)-2-C-methyl-D-erythritol kinase [Oscillospiraceae bacterium]
MMLSRFEIAQGEYSMTTIKENAYAKINLFLDIKSKMDNGYHNIISVMQSVGLYDTVSVEYEPSKYKSITVTCSNPNIPVGKDNIAYKAAGRLIESGTVNIHIEKNIPAAAGLAGGSTDAAAVLKLLNQLLNNKYTTDELLAIGAKIGADVPFCMVGGTCLTQGIGDRITKFPSMPDRHILIARAGEGVSTPTAYAALDKMYNDFKEYVPQTRFTDTAAGKNDKTYFEGMFNIFESVILPTHSSAASLKSIMLAGGADHAMMSGSGPSVFGIFSCEDKARDTLAQLKKFGAETYLCRPVSP